MDKKTHVSSILFYSLAVLGLIGLFGTLFNQVKIFLFTLFYTVLLVGAVLFVYNFIFKEDFKPIKIEQKKKKKRRRDVPHLLVLQGGKTTRRDKKNSTNKSIGHNVKLF